MLYFKTLKNPVCCCLLFTKINLKEVRLKRFFLTLIIICGFGLTWFPPIVGTVRAEETVDRIQKPVKQSISIRRTTQKEREQWQAEQTRLEARLQSLQVENQQLAGEQKALQDQIDGFRKKNSRLTTQIQNSALLSRKIGPYLETVYRRLKELIKTDRPFLKDERQSRLNTLRLVLDDPEATVSEKYRRVLEALLIEAEYGSTIEVYRTTIQLEGRELTASLLRLGRVSVFFQSPDKKETGYYDMHGMTWRALPDSYNRDINTAFEIAAKRRPIKLVNLPLGRLAAP